MSLAKEQADFFEACFSANANLEVANRLQLYRRTFQSSMRDALKYFLRKTHEALGDKWEKVTQEFFQKHGFDSPYFRDIPFAFLEFLKTQEDISVFEICDLECTEHYLKTMQVEVWPEVSNDPEFPISEGKVVWNPALAWKDYLHSSSKYLVVVRDPQTLKVQTHLLTPKAWECAQMLQASSQIKIGEIKIPSEVLVSFLQEALSQKIILGFI